MRDVSRWCSILAANLSRGPDPDRLRLSLLSWVMMQVKRYYIESGGIPSDLEGTYLAQSLDCIAALIAMAPNTWPTVLESLSTLHGMALTRLAPALLAGIVSSATRSIELRSNSAIVKAMVDHLRYVPRGLRFAMAVHLVLVGGKVAEDAMGIRGAAAVSASLALAATTTDRTSGRVDEAGAAADREGDRSHGPLATVTASELLERMSLGFLNALDSARFRAVVAAIAEKHEVVVTADKLLFLQLLDSAMELGSWPVLLLLQKLFLDRVPDALVPTVAERDEAIAEWRRRSFPTSTHRVARGLFAMFQMARFNRTLDSLLAAMASARGEDLPGFEDIPDFDARMGFPNTDAVHPTVASFACRMLLNPSTFSHAKTTRTFQELHEFGTVEVIVVDDTTSAPRRYGTGEGSAEGGRSWREAARRADASGVTRSALAGPSTDDGGSELHEAHLDAGHRGSRGFASDGPGRSSREPADHDDDAMGKHEDEASDIRGAQLGRASASASASARAPSAFSPPVAPSISPSDRSYAAALTTTGTSGPASVGRRSTVVIPDSLAAGIRSLLEAEREVEVGLDRRVVLPLVAGIPLREDIIASRLNEVVPMVLANHGALIVIGIDTLRHEETAGLRGAERADELLTEPLVIAGSSSPSSVAMNLGDARTDRLEMAVDQVMSSQIVRRDHSIPIVQAGWNAVVEPFDVVGSGTHAVILVRVLPRSLREQLVPALGSAFAARDAAAVAPVAAPAPPTPERVSALAVGAAAAAAPAISPPSVVAPAAAAAQQLIVVPQALLVQLLGKIQSLENRLNLAESELAANRNRMAEVLTIVPEVRSLAARMDRVDVAVNELQRSSLRIPAAPPAFIPAGLDGSGLLSASTSEASARAMGADATSAADSQSLLASMAGLQLGGLWMQPSPSAAGGAHGLSMSTLSTPDGILSAYGMGSLGASPSAAISLGYLTHPGAIPYSLTATGLTPVHGSSSPRVATGAAHDASTLASLLAASGQPPGTGRSAQP